MEVLVVEVLVVAGTSADVTAVLDSVTSNAAVLTSIHIIAVYSYCPCLIREMTLKPGFHYPSSWAELTARQLGCIFDTRQLGPSTRVLKSSCPARAVYTGVRFPLPELTAGVDGCQKVHPS